MDNGALSHSKPFCWPPLLHAQVQWNNSTCCICLLQVCETLHSLLHWSPPICAVERNPSGDTHAIYLLWQQLQVPRHGKSGEHILTFLGLLRPTWVLENYQNGVSAWQTTSWWAQPCSIISIAEESTHICGSSTRRRSMQGRYFNKYGIKHRIIQFTGHSVWEQLEWWRIIPHAFRNFLLRKPSDHQSAFSLVIPKTWHCFDLIGASPQKSLMLPSYMCCDFQSNVFRCHPLGVIVIEKL